MTATGDMVATNMGIYQRSTIARWYGTLQGLTPAETAAFEATADAWRGGDVLDIGIGGGRTSEFLAPEARSYTAVDYSPAMVEVARARHPDLDIRQADARDLSLFAAASFDFLYFADNGIDAVDDEGRRKILSEALRVLRPGGVFVLNAHNLDCARNGHHWGDMLRIRFSRSPIETAKSIAWVPLRVGNYVKGLANRVRTDRYAILHDPGNNFASPHYYCGAAEMRRQVMAAGFQLTKVLSEAGRETDADVERESATLYYLLRRPLAAS